MIFLKTNSQTKIYQALINTIGLNKSTSQFICKKFGFQKKSSLRHLDNLELEQLNFFLSTNFRLNDSLTDQTKNNIKTKIDLSTYSGKRHNLGYPVRGQRTLSNGKTQKKLYKFRLYYDSKIFNYTFLEKQRQKKKNLKSKKKITKIKYNDKSFMGKGQKKIITLSYKTKLKKVKEERQKLIDYKFKKAHKDAQINHPYFKNIRKSN